MKKTLVSIIAGLTVIGSAFALPSPEDIKALCEKHPDKYVWVEKSQACIPINPCESDDVDIERAYCVNRTITPNKKELLINRYVEQVLKTTVVDVQNVPGDVYAYSGVKTADGGYFVLRAGQLGYSNYGAEHMYTAYTNDERLEDMVNAAALVYANGKYCKERTDENGNRLCEFHDIDVNQCHNMIMFAEELADELPYGHYEKETRVCSFTW